MSKIKARDDKNDTQNNARTPQFTPQSRPKAPSIREKCVTILSYLFEQGPYSYEKLVIALAGRHESPMQTSTIQSHIEKTATMNSDKAKYYKKRLPKLLKMLDEFKTFNGDFEQAYEAVTNSLHSQTNSVAPTNDHNIDNTATSKATEESVVLENNASIHSEPSANLVANATHHKSNYDLIFHFLRKTKLYWLGYLSLVISLLSLMMMGIDRVQTTIETKSTHQANDQVAGQDIINRYTIEQHEQRMKDQLKEVIQQYQARFGGHYATGLQGGEVLQLETHLLEKKLAEIQGQIADVSASYNQRILFLEDSIKALNAFNPGVDAFLLQEAQTALLAGFTDEADDLFKQIEEQAQFGLTVAAQSAFQRGLIAENNTYYQQAFAHYQRAIGYPLPNAQYFEKAGLMAGIVAQFNKQLQWTEKSLALYQQQSNPNPADIARLRNNLGLAWQNKGHYKKAIAYFSQSLASDLTIFDEHHPTIIERRSNLGLAWFDNGNYDKAIGYFEQALVSGLKTEGENDPKLAQMYNNLGMVWRAKGNYDKAIAYLGQALAINLKALGEGHPNVARNHNNLGLAWRSKGFYNKAIVYYELALSSNLKNWGKNHPKTARSFNNLGVAWHFQGDDTKSIDYFKLALSINLKILGEDHASVTLHRSNLGKIQYYKGNYNAAIEYYESALRSSLKILGKNHPDVAREYNKLGEVWVAKGNYEQAIDYYEMALANNLGNFGKNHPIVAQNHHNLGIAWFYKEAHLEKVMVYFEQALNTRRKILGEEHPDTQSTIKWIADVENQLKNSSGYTTNLADSRILLYD